MEEDLAEDLNEDSYDVNDSFIDDEYEDDSDDNNEEYEKDDEVSDDLQDNADDDSDEVEVLDKVLATPKDEVSTTKKKSFTFLSSLSKSLMDSKCCHPDAVKYLKNFNKNKEELASRLYKLYNQEAFDNQLPDGMEIVWCPRLTKTAGVCCLVAKTNKLTKSVTRSCKIKLSVKVLDGADRLRDTLVHEMCHAAAWLISGCKGGHGPVWKSWAKKAMKRFPELPVISRCHNYEIRTKFVYVCRDCGHRYGRHSKSIDTEKKCCGKCKGQLVLNTGQDMGQTPRAPNKYALFVKDNYKHVRTPGVTHGDAMKQLSSMFKDLKT